MKIRDSIPLLFFGLLLAASIPGCESSPKVARTSPKPKAEGAAKDIRGNGTADTSASKITEPDTIQTARKPAIDQPVRKDRANVQSDSEGLVQSRLRPTISFPESGPLPEFRQPTEQEVAAMALGRIGKPAVPSLIQALRHRDTEVRRQAALVLARIGPEAADAVPELTEALDDPHETVRKAAGRALGQIGSAAAPAVPALMRTLVQPKPVPPKRSE